MVPAPGFPERHLGTLQIEVLAFKDRKWAGQGIGRSTSLGAIQQEVNLGLEEDRLKVVGL